MTGHVPAPASGRGRHLVGPSRPALAGLVVLLAAAAPAITEETPIAQATAGATGTSGDIFAALRPAASLAPEEPPAGSPGAAEPEPAPVQEPIVPEPKPKPLPVPVREPIASEPVPVRTPIVPAPVRAPIVAETPDFGARVVAGARRSVDRAPRYDPTYVHLAYPGGDPPPEQGGAVDLVIRAFREAGVDLQRALHEDLLAQLGAYPISRPDPSIDHRRLRNLVILFDRRATALPTGPDGGWAPGDVVFWDRNSDGIAGHLGIVTDETAPSGDPLVAHHHRPTGDFAGTPGVDDVLFRWPVVGHYRWPAGDAAATPAATSRPAPTAASAVLAAVEETVRAWARAWAEKRIEEYLGFYSRDFRPRRGLSRSTWEARRRVRLERPSSIAVGLDRLASRLTAADRAEVSFVQTYRSELYADKVDKILTLRREEDGWRLLSERVVQTYSE